MDVRTATPGDCASLVSMAVAFRNHLERSTPTEAQFQDSIGSLLTSTDAEFYVAAEGGEPIGYVLQRFRYSMWVAGLEATLEDLFVSPNQRQRGTGKRLIEYAVARAQAKGCASVCLDTNENNVASNRIYVGMGFNAVSKRWQGRQLFYRLNLPATDTL